MKSLQRIARSFFKATTLLLCLVLGEVSGLAACVLGGTPLWDDEHYHIWSISQSGNVLDGTEVFSCGTGAIDESQSRNINGFITMKVLHPFGCSTSHTWFSNNSTKSAGLTGGFPTIGKTVQTLLTMGPVALRSSNG
jgi:hypothetical protein